MVGSRSKDPGIDLATVIDSGAIHHVALVAAAPPAPTKVWNRPVPELAAIRRHCPHEPVGVVTVMKFTWRVPIGEFALTIRPGRLTTMAATLILILSAAVLSYRRSTGQRVPGAGARSHRLPAMTSPGPSALKVAAATACRVPWPAHRSSCWA